MKFIRDLSRSERDLLKSKYFNTKDFKTHFSDVIDQKHFYEIDLYPNDYERIWIFSCIFNLTTYPNQRLSEVIVYLKSQMDFTKDSAPMFLNLQQVMNYVDVLTHCKDKTNKCF